MSSIGRQRGGQQRRGAGRGGQVQDHLPGLRQLQGRAEGAGQGDAEEQGLLRRSWSAKKPKSLFGESPLLKLFLLMY